MPQTISGEFSACGCGTSGSKLALGHVTGRCQPTLPTPAFSCRSATEVALEYFQGAATPPISHDLGQVLASEQVGWRKSPAGTEAQRACRLCLRCFVCREERLLQEALPDSPRQTSPPPFSPAGLLSALHLLRSSTGFEARILLFSLSH